MPSESEQMSRRTFVKTTSVASLVAATATATLPQRAHAAGPAGMI